MEGNPSKPTGQAGMDMLKRMNISHREEINWGLNLLKVHPKKILDIGCGGGATIANLLNRYPDASIYGVDFSEVAVKLTSDLNKNAIKNKKVFVQQASLEDLPFSDNSFDLVLSLNTYFFWDNFDLGLKSIKRILTKDGTVFLLGDAYKGVQQTEDFKKIDNKFNLKLKSPEEFKKALLNEGFRDIEVKTKEKEQWIAVIAKK